MKQLRLDDLRVDSFETGDEPVVTANAFTIQDCRTQVCTQDDAGGATCYFSCGATGGLLRQCQC